MKLVVVYVLSFLCGNYGTAEQSLRGICVKYILNVFAPVK